ncbi:MAG TPA: SCO family protein [Fimbriimonadaceae bacterium]|nr:SCO family protein [Fimbriimonadaceae bacterium]
MKCWLTLLFGISFSVAFAQDAVFSGPSGPPSTQPKVDLSKVHIVQRLGIQVPLDTTFRDQDGRVVRLGDSLHSRPALVLPIFYRCQGVCNVELQGLLATLPQLKQKIGKDYDVVVLSIDPQEGPDLAKAKLQASLATSPELKGTEPGWHFLTGTLENIHKVTDALGFYYTYDADKDLINHPSGIMFLTPAGVISSYILGANYTTSRLSLDINVANAKKLGTKVEDIFFGCIHCDPITGRKSIVIERFLSLLGVVTVVSIVATLATLSGFRWRKKRKALL